MAEAKERDEESGKSSGTRKTSQLLRPLSAIIGRPLILALGAFYMVTVAAYPVLPFVGDSPPELWAVLAVLVGGPGLILFVGGYRLSGTEIRPELYTIIGKWCLRGIGGALAISVIIVLASSNTDVVPNGLLLTALGSLAGFAAGTYDARSKTRRLELQETIDQLRASNERLEQFVYAASHDLQEPLRMVSSYLQLLESRYQDDLDEDAQEFIAFAVDGADRMRAMIDSLLKYSRVTTRGDPLAPTDAGEVLDDVCDGLEQRIEATDASITADDLPTVYADEKQLEQVFHHLLENAIEFSGDDTPQVHLSAERVGDWWQFNVTDDGIGIAPEFHDRVFEVFEKVHAGDQAPEIGSGGIGLALCKRIVERHDGDIWVESSEGDGATFSFTLPTLPENSDY